MTQIAFFDKVIFDETERGKIVHYLKCRGISEHIFVFEYLQGFKSDSVTYSEIATAFRYDKRIRRVLFKYIGFVEENLRAYIINKYENNINILSKTKKLQEMLIKESSLYYAVCNLTFGELIRQCKKLSSEEIKELFADIEFSNKNIDAIVGLRNEVSHNRFLLHNKRLKACSVGGNKGHSLWANINNLYNYLPNFLKEKFKEEIKECSLYKENSLDNQTKWHLLKDIIIDL